MIGFMPITVFPPLIPGRLKMKASKVPHRKERYADVCMNLADGMAEAASIFSVASIDMGFWRTESKTSEVPWIPWGCLFAPVADPFPPTADREDDP